MAVGAAVLLALVFASAEIQYVIASRGVTIPGLSMHALQLGRRLLADPSPGPASTPPPSSPSGNFPLIIADGGESFIYPAMTEKAYNMAMENGADFLLCRIALSSDHKAVCQPSVKLAEYTNIEKTPLDSRSSSGYPSYNFTLNELLSLKAKQPVQEYFGTRVFDNKYPPLQPKDVIDLILQRRTVSQAKPVGLAIEFPHLSELSEYPNQAAVAADYRQVLATVNASALGASSTIFISNDKATAEVFVGLKGQVKLYLLKVAEMYTPEAMDIGTFDGLVVPVGALQNETQKDVYGQPLPFFEWREDYIRTVHNLGFKIFVGGFASKNWLSYGAAFNTYVGDPVLLYRSLLYGRNISGIVDGLVTSSVTPAAIAAVCYKNPVKNLTAPKMRPYLLSSGGSQALVPSQTGFAFEQAVKEGGEILDCNVQISKDNFLFCFPEISLRERTDAESQGFINRSFQFVADPDKEAVASIWSFNLTWSEIRNLKAKSSKKSNILRRPVVFENSVNPLLLDGLLNISRNANRSVGLFLRIDNPTALKMLQPPINIVSTLLAWFREKGLIDANNVYAEGVRPPLWVGSFDQCALQDLHKESNGTIVTLQKVDKDFLEPCSIFVNRSRVNYTWWLTDEGLTHISTYARGISPGRNVITSVSPTYFLMNDSNTVIPRAKERELLVVPKVFANDEAMDSKTQGSYDALGTPYLVFQQYFDQLQVNALETQIVVSAATFFESSCRVTPPVGFNISTIRVGRYLEEGADDSKGGKLSAGVIAAIVVGSIMLFAIITAAGILACLFCHGRWPFVKKKEQLQQQGFSPIKLGGRSTLRKFTAEELFEATNNFDQSRSLGKGAAGTVYKGVLPDGREIAVKRLGISVLGSGPPSKSENAKISSLGNEVAIIGAVNNRNVVTLQGYCVDKEWLLVYDFMPNGSLDDALFKPDYPVKLNWDQWLNIIFGIAKGLAYLHEECVTQIIHRDIKPANILLDANFNARLADFGIARNAEIDETHVTTAVMGTFGYVAPDYAATGQLTVKSDVYSFGVVALVILSQKKPSVTFMEQALSLESVQELAAKGEEELLRVISPKFEGQYDPDKAIRWLYIALLCIQSQPALRPSMGEVVEMLQGHKEIPDICITPARVVFPRMRDSRSRNNWSNGNTSSTNENSQHTISDMSRTSEIATFSLTDLEGR